MAGNLPLAAYGLVHLLQHWFGHCDRFEATQHTPLPGKTGPIEQGLEHNRDQRPPVERSVRLLGPIAAAAPAAFWAGRHVRSAAVKAWSPSEISARRFGALHARVGGDGDHAVMLLHGLVSTGAIFGHTFDEIAATGRVVVPDLLGFGQSLDESRTSFLLEDHLDALDDLAERSGMFRYPRWHIGAHSMGAVVALAWAKRHSGHIDRVTCWGPPVYASSSDAEAHISGTLMTRLFVLDTNLAKRACAFSCRHRTAAGWLTAAVEPRLPIAVARAVSLHTWPAYRDALRHLVIEADWLDLLDSTNLGGPRVELVWGEGDQIGDRSFAHELAQASTRVGITVVADADHRLPMTHASLCVSQLEHETR